MNVSVQRGNAVPPQMKRREAPRESTCTCSLGKFLPSFTVRSRSGCCSCVSRSDPLLCSAQPSPVFFRRCNKEIINARTHSAGSCFNIIQSQPEGLLYGVKHYILLFIYNFFTFKQSCLSYADLTSNASFVTNLI